MRPPEPPVHRPPHWRAVAVAICVALLAAAFVLAPSSCAGGLDTYAWLGVLALAALGALPYLIRRSARPDRPQLVALGGVALGGATWVGGLFVANFQVLCRLF